MLDSLLPSVAQRSSLEKATGLFEENRDALASYLLARGIGKEAAFAQRLGCVSDDAPPGFERFRGMMSVPYATPGGVVHMKFRRIDGSEHGPKYDSLSMHAHLYNAGVLADPKMDRVVITEGELDAILCTHEVGVPAVGTPGTTWLEHWPRCFSDLDDIVIVADHDVKPDGSSPGLKHAKKVQATIGRARIVTPPPGMDLGEWYLAEGREAVLKGMGFND